MPSKEKKRELYIATSMAELQKKSEVKPSTTNARILVKSADTMFHEAEKTDSNGDEEKAFILYMRYFNIVKQVKLNADYKKNKQYYDNLLGQKNQVRAIEQAEQLAESLKERYELKEAEAVANKFAALEASGKRQEKVMDVEDSVKNNKVNGSAVDTNSTQSPSTSTDSQVTQPNITPTALCNLLRDPSAQLILMDTRKAVDFAESHINHAACISIPQEVLTPGSTVTRIESQLPQESLSLWKQRGNVDHIILLDWSSKLDAVTIGTTLRTLKDALFKYDSTVIIKSEPLVLEGGYDQWLLTYPTMTTNARVSRPSASSVTSSVALLDFDYPDFEDAQPAKPEQPQTAKPTVPNLTDFVDQQGVDTIAKVPSSGSVPQFNRALKPKSSGSSIMDSINKTSELNNARNLNLVRDTQAGEGMSMLSNNLYPSVVVATKKGEKNTNIAADKTRVFEDSNKVAERPTPTPTIPSSVDSQQEAEERAKLKALEDKRKREEKALADIMRQKRHMEQDLKEMQRLALRENEAREAHEKSVREEEAERKRQAEVERLRLERKKKEFETQKEKEQQAKDREMQEAKDREMQEAKDREIQEARDREIQEAKEKARKEEEEKQAAQRAAQQHAEKLRQERAEQARQEAEQKKLDDEWRAAAARREEEERKQREEERKKKEEKERKEKERLETVRQEEAARKAKQAEQEKRAQEAEKVAAAASSTDGIRHAQEPKMIPSPSLPVGWEKRLDSATRRYYYIDHNRGKTQWEPPVTTREPQKTETYTTKLKEEPAVSSSRGLSRSHSSPDIMKQLADEAKGIGKPVFDRTSKPSVRTSETSTPRASALKQVARRRDLNPVYGNVGSALTGLRNLGNTCYMNSTIQCLSNTTPLVTYFLTDAYQNDINRDSVQGMHGEVVDEFAVVVKALWSGQYRCITPRDLKNTVGQYNPMFAGYQQQDSQEFLTFLLDGLHEGLNEIQKRPQIPDQENDRLPDIKAAELAWENHKRLHRSIIVELFQGQLKSTLMCRTCHKKSVTFQAFMYISLPIPSSNRCTLRDCFRAFLQPEMMTGSCKWKCPQCRVERDAEKKIDIWKLPHILLIGLNRFVSDGMWMQKKTSYVDFPINDLDLEEFTLGPKERSRYSLYGVSNHYGTMEGGHYTAFCRNPCNDKWHKFDDHEVYEMSKSDVKTSAAFVLYYSNIPLNAPQFKPQL